MRSLALALTLLLCASAPAAAAKPAAPASAAAREVPSPAGPGSAEPCLAADAEGHAYLSWLEPVAGARHAVRLSTWQGGAWSKPLTVVEDDSLFVNWADFPVIVALPGGGVGACWMRKSGAGTYDYQVWLARSSDGGKTWTRPVVPHRDPPRGEHGFVSLLPWPGGGVAAFWIDGRKDAGEGGAGHEEEEEGHVEMALRHAVLDADGNVSDEVLLDTRTCECCQTGAALTAEGAVVVYRDRSEQEIRDTYAVRHEGGRWSDPFPVAREGWRIAGCPVNGPAVAAAGARVAVAWYTGAADSAQVRVAFSEDGGRSFGAPVTVDGGSPVGRAGIVLLPDGAAAVSWIESQGDTAFVKLRRVDGDGRLGRALTVAGTSAARRSGFPRLARAGDLILCAWTDAGRPSRVRTGAVRVAELR